MKRRQKPKNLIIMRLSKHCCKTVLILKLRDFATGEFQKYDGQLYKEFLLQNQSQLRHTICIMQNSKMAPQQQKQQNSIYFDWFRYIKASQDDPIFLGSDDASQLPSLF